MDQNEQAVKEQSVEADKGIVYPCYLGILVIVPLLIKRDSVFVKFHVK